MPNATMHFPDDFLWGTATASYQVEGNNTNSDWHWWEQQQGTILNNDKAGLASDWWQNAEQDLQLAADMGTNAHRMSLEWSRIEPEPNVFDEDAIARYRQLLQFMHDHGIEPMVTLHHFSNPIWLRELGDFDSPDIVPHVIRYTQKVVDTLGDLIPKWITINEPMVYVYMRYLDKKFPAPIGEVGYRPMFRAIENLLRAHAAMYHTIKDARPQAQVGISKNAPVFDPYRKGTLTQWWANRTDWAFNGMWMNANTTGKLSFPLRGGQIKGLKNSYDFIGLNYYTRFYAKFLQLPKQSWDSDIFVSDGNYGEVYPHGIYRMIKYMHKFNKPIYITENGVPDHDDDMRSAFILTHLREVWRSINFNIPVMGYYHWSLVDNFEWDRGWTQRFGLLSLNPKTQQRTLTDSGKLYGEICHANALTTDQTNRYAPEIMDMLFFG